MNKRNGALSKKKIQKAPKEDLVKSLGILLLNKINSEKKFMTKTYRKKYIQKLENVFDRMHVQYTHLQEKKRNLENLSSPFITYLKNQDGAKGFVLVTSITKTEIQYIDENKTKKIVLKNDFLNNWTEDCIQLHPKT